LIILQWFLLVACGILMLHVFILLIQVVAAIALPKPVMQLAKLAIRPKVVVLMPAHNESLVIAQTIQAIMPQLNSDDQLLVVADNCTDDTAQIAGALGAVVAKRTNQQQRGKGYALDYGLQQLKQNPPQVVIIIDADCLISSNAIAELAQACTIYQRPTQALYLMHAQPDPSLKARIATFAWIVKNKVRPLGFERLGLPCQLMGTGMAFLWQDLMQINLASGHIVEDMKLGVDLCRINKPPLFLPNTLVTSFFPPSQAATKTQRARWEHGHLSVIINEAPGLIFEAIKNKNSQMLGLACDLIVPPLAILVLLCLVIFVASFALYYFTGFWLASLFALLLLVMLASAVILAWLTFGRAIISFKQLCYAPVYALTKIPLYIKFFVNRQVEWVRSKRD
jgi:glycosyltransferase involved in cell wall biosynthesis